MKQLRKTLSVPNLNSFAKTQTVPRRLVLQGLGLCNSLSVHALENVLLRAGVNNAKWPIDEKDLSFVIRSYVAPQTCEGNVQFLLTYALHEGLAFYQLLFNRDVKDHSFVLRLVFQQYCRVFEQIKNTEACTPQGLENLSKLKDAMASELVRMTELV